MLRFASVCKTKHQRVNARMQLDSQLRTLSSSLGPLLQTVDVYDPFR